MYDFKPVTNGVISSSRLCLCIPLLACGDERNGVRTTPPPSRLWTRLVTQHALFSNSPHRTLRDVPCQVKKERKKEKKERTPPNASKKLH